MPYSLSLATPQDRDLVVTALREAADKRSRVARTGGRWLAAEKRAGKDVRPAAVRIALLLGEAGDLESLAAELEAATEVAILSVDAAGAITTTAIPDPKEGAVDVEAAVAELRAQLTGDDGTSAEAQALAALAGLSPADPDAVEDPLTNALPEDEPTKPEEIL